MTDILLVHGALGARHQLAPLRQLLEAPTDAGSPAAHRLHLVELEGHGGTAADRPYDIASFAQNLRDFMKAHDIAHAGIFGYSMGGYVALALAAESPELVTSIATLGTKFAWSPAIARREVATLDAPTIRAKVPKFAAMLEDRHAGAGGWELVLGHTAHLMTTLGERAWLDADAFAKITQSVRLIVGDRDSVVTVEETAATAATLAKGELCVLPATAHPFERVRLPLLASVLRDFFGS